MSLEIKIDRDIYERGVYLYKTGAFTFEPGLTVLIGCNGSGKTTLLKQIKKNLSSDGKPFIFFQYDRERLERDNRLTYGDANARGHMYINVIKESFDLIQYVPKEESEEAILTCLDNLKKEIIKREQALNYLAKAFKKSMEDHEC